ncbi:MAG: sulfur carrier protein ThiS [Chloroflexota bacterium]
MYTELRVRWLSAFVAVSRTLVQSETQITMINVIVNGQESELESSMTINEFLEMKGFGGRSVAVAINSVVIRRATFDETMINDGDQVEIVRPVGGGQN